MPWLEGFPGIKRGVERLYQWLYSTANDPEQKHQVRSSRFRCMTDWSPAVSVAGTREPAFSYAPMNAPTTEESNCFSVSTLSTIVDMPRSNIVS